MIVRTFKGRKLGVPAVALSILAHSVAMIVYRREGASEHLHTALHTATYTQYTTRALRT